MKKCRYKYCKHNKEITDSEAIKDGNAYYHPDCLHEKKTIKKIIDAYIEYVDPHPVFSQLRKTIDTIVHINNTDVDFLLYAVIKLGKEQKLKHIPGLYYLSKNENLLKEWKKINAADKIANDNYIITDTVKTYKYNQKKKKTVTDLF